jgi:hypothetical protein
MAFAVITNAANERVSAEFTFHVVVGSDLIFSQGQTSALIPVYAYSNATDTGRFVDDFNLGFDLSGPGLDGAGPGYSSNFSIVGANFGADFPDNQDLHDFSTLGPDNFDLLASAGAAVAGTVDITDYSQTTPLKLFDLEFDIAPGTAPGEYKFSFVPDASFGGIAVNNLAGSTSTFAFAGSGGSFTVTAVPEPTSLALAGAGLAAFVGGRRLKKKRSAKSEGLRKS